MRIAIIAPIVIVFAAGGGSPALATAQRGDILLVGSREGWIQTNPLEPWFESHPEARPRSQIICTGLWRGYVATWRIESGRLLLTDVQILDQDEESEEPETVMRSVMGSVFPGDAPVPAVWFTGYLIAPSGDRVEYVHMGYASTYERYTVYTVIEGQVVARRSMRAPRFRRFRDSQFEAYRKTPEYDGVFRKLEEKGDTAAEIERFLFEYETPRYMSIIFDDSPLP